MIAKTPSPPYYAVIFSSFRTNSDNDKYSKMSDFMISLAETQDGFLGVESVRNVLGITVSYWRDLEAIHNWKHHAEHEVARKKGRYEWYTSFKVRIARVERDYDFGLEIM